MRDRASTFPVLENRERIRRMRIWHCKYKTLQPLADFKNVEELVIATFPDKTLSALASMRNLRYLHILHMPKITDLRELSHLSELESLALATSPAWDASGKCTVVESLEPIAAITGLKHLELFGVCPPSKSLASLEQLKNLQSARFSQYPKAEIDRFFLITGVLNQFNPKPSLGHKPTSNRFGQTEPPRL